MKFIKTQKDKYTLTPAILFSLMVHFAAGILLLFFLSTNSVSSPVLKEIKLVWISFDEKIKTGKVEFKNTLSHQTSSSHKITVKEPANSETPLPHPESIQISAVTTSLPNDHTSATNGLSGSIEPKEKSYYANEYSKNETSGNKANVNTLIAYPLYKENSPPVYPEIARTYGYEGIVLVFAEILPNGRVGEVKIRKSSGYAILDQSAIKAVKPWKFEPAKKSGTPFTAWVELPIKFVLHNNSQS